MRRLLTALAMTMVTAMCSMSAATAAPAPGFDGRCCVCTGECPRRPPPPPLAESKTMAMAASEYRTE